MAQPSPNAVGKTASGGNNYENMMRTLIETSADADQRVQESVIRSLTEIGLKAPPLLLNCIHAHLANNTKVTHIYCEIFEF